MKKFTKCLFVVGALFTIVAKLQSTTYYPFPEQNAIWNFRMVDIGVAGSYEKNFTFLLTGDTLIGNQTYHKLTYYYYVLSAPRGFYDGAIRQNIAAKKVYYIAPMDTTEYLLYDFTLQLGDTVKGYIQTGGNEKDTVISIDSVLVGDSYRKRWLVNSNFNIYFMRVLVQHLDC